MRLNPLIFREYDIRGVVGADLDDEVAYRLGRAYAGLAKDCGADNIAVGFDCRHSSEPFAEAVAQGLLSEGLRCAITGRGPTPQLYWSLFKKGFGGGIQVTGSHNPPDMNGFKVCLGTRTLSGPEIQDLKRRMEAAAAQVPAAAPKRQKAPRLAVSDDYAEDLILHLKPHMGARRLKVVADAGNGAAGELGPRVLSGIGVEVIELYCEPDGDFPNHHPDPTVMEYIRDLIAKVKETGADFGIGWDGDGDRIGAVDEAGRVIFGDMLMVLYARAVLRAEPGAMIIGDVKCSSRLFDEVRRLGGSPLMWKTGHSLMKNKLRETGAALAGEMSGHIFFKHRFYGFDDAIYCAGRLAEIASHAQGPLSGLLADLPPAVATPEIRVDCPDELKFEVAKRAQQSFAEFKVNTTDGVRIDFDHGWGLIRASNTQPVLVMRFEADSRAHLEEYQKLVTARIEAIERELGG